VTFFRLHSVLTNTVHMQNNSSFPQLNFVPHRKISCISALLQLAIFIVSRQSLCHLSPMARLSTTCGPIAINIRKITFSSSNSSFKSGCMTRNVHLLSWSLIIATKAHSRPAKWLATPLSHMQYGDVTGLPRKLRQYGRRKIRC